MGTVVDKKFNISLKLGKPVILNHLQMVALKNMVFPFSWLIPTFVKARTPAEQILDAIVKRLEEPINVVNIKKHSILISPSSGTENESRKLDETMVLVQLDTFAFRLHVFQETIERILQIFVESPFGKEIASLGKYRTAVLPLSTPNNPHHIAFPTLYPMPSGKIFAASLKTGKILRNKAPMMLLGTITQDKKITCRILWFDNNSHASTQSLPKTNELFEITFA